MDRQQEQLSGAVGA